MLHKGVRVGAGSLSSFSPSRSGRGFSRMPHFASNLGTACSQHLRQSGTMIPSPRKDTHQGLYKGIYGLGFPKIRDTLSGVPILVVWGLH